MKQRNYKINLKQNECHDPFYAWWECRKYPISFVEAYQFKNKLDEVEELQNELEAKN